MHLRSDSFPNGASIPTEFAFGKPGDPVALADNRNPHLAWHDSPAGTRSFVLTCVDPHAPSKPDDVNKQGRLVPPDLPRVEFTHWLMVDIPRECGELAAASCSDGIVPHGKSDPVGPPGSRQGINDYTSWFDGDADMHGTYCGYDGPCPPWNDALLHRYRFEVFALDVAALDLPAHFGWAELQAALAGHVLDSAELTGSYSLNPALA